MPLVVWAIDEEHYVNYYFPRDCPRVINSKSNNISAEDEKLESYIKGKDSIAIEIERKAASWYQTVKNIRNDEKLWLLIQPIFLYK